MHAVARPLPDSRGINLFAADPSYASLLSLYLTPELRAHLLPHLTRLGALAGGELDEAAATADRNPPLLHQRTRAGEDRQWIEKHPAYRRLEEVAFAEYGLAAMSHRGGVLGWPQPLPPMAKYALTYVFVQAEFGVCCPLSMTDSLARTLRKYGGPALVDRFLPALTSQDLDALAQGAMFMTEQDAGSDVGGTATRAVRIESAAPGNPQWRLYGDKWFCSNADAALALVLARPEGAAAGTKGLALFLLPRTLPDGSPNDYRIVRLKDKLGTRAMPSGEIRLAGASAYLIGDPGRGFVQMTDMINMSRLSNGMRAAGMMRRALTEALFIASRRVAFGKTLIELSLVRRQLLKLMLSAEAARSMVFFTANELAKADAGDDEARKRVRLLTPLLKFRACRDARRATGDAMEVRGGCGYIEEWSDARLVRDAHLGSIWEGTSNIVALDAMRAIRREGSLDALVPALDSALPRDQLGQMLRVALRRAGVLAREAKEIDARQAATGLYYVTAACVLAVEGEALAAQGDMRRKLLARLVYEHRLRSRDPFERSDATLENTLADTLLPETPVAPELASAIVQSLAKD